MNLKEYPQVVLNMTCEEYLGLVNVHGLTGKVLCPGRVRDIEVIESTIRNLGNTDYLKKKMKDKDDNHTLIYNLDLYLSNKPIAEFNAAHFFMARLAKQVIHGYEVSVKDDPIAKKYNIEKYNDLIAFLVKFIGNLQDEESEIRKEFEENEIISKQLTAWIDLEEKIKHLIEDGNYVIDREQDYFYIAITSYDTKTGPSEDN